MDNKNNFLVLSNDNKLLNVHETFTNLLEHITEAEFMQMVLPLIHLLPVEKVQFLLNNCTSDELVQIIPKIQDPVILNIIAVETTDPILVHEVAKSNLLTLESLNVLFDKFSLSPLVALYTKHPVADTTFLHKVTDCLFANHKKDSYKDAIANVAIPDIYEPVILEHICNNAKADASLLEVISVYVENMICEMRTNETKLDEVKKEYGKTHRWSMDGDVLDKTPEKKAYDMCVKRVKHHFKVLLAVCSHLNTPESILLHLFQKYGKYSVHNINQNVPGIAMQFLGYTHDETIGYRVLTNATLKPEFREQHLANMLNENKGIYESGGDGQEYLNRVCKAPTDDAVRIIYYAWCKEEDKDGWKISHASMSEFFGALSQNSNAPEDIIEAAVERACRYCEHENKTDIQYYFEYFQNIVNHKNLNGVSFIRIILALRSMAESNNKSVRRHFEWSIERVLNPLCKNNSMTEEAAKECYNLLMTQKTDDVVEALVSFAGLSCASVIDYELEKIEIPAVLIRMASRTLKLDILERLIHHDYRDVAVVARRQYAKLINKTTLLGTLNNVARIGD